MIDGSILKDNFVELASFHLLFTLTAPFYNMATWGLKMLEAALKKNATSSTSTSTVTSDTTVNRQVDVNPDDPFDVESNISNDQNEEMKTAEDEAIDEFNMISDVCNEDANYIPNSASEDSDDSGSESIIYPSVPMLSPRFMPVTTSSAGSLTQNKDCAMDADTTTPDTSCPIGARSKKPLRNCKFCNKWQTHLKRHIVRLHKNEAEVVAALQLPTKEQADAFASMRKVGTFNKNMELVKQRLPLIRERNQGTSDTIMCSGCRGFYDRKTIFKHKRSCSKSFSNNPSSVIINRQSANAELLDLPTDFVDNVLNRFRKDKVGDLCKKDLAVLLLGKRLWSKSIKKERHVIMSEMRLFGNLIVAFQKYTPNEETTGVDVLHYSQFGALEKAIHDLTRNDTSCKSGLKLRLGFILKRAAKVMRGYYITKGEFDKEKEIERFLNALQLQWDFIFYTAQVECESKREGLRKPASMPDQTDIQLLRNFISEKMEFMLRNEEYELWDSSKFTQLRNLIVTRLTMFNARRSGEPVRITLSEWNDATQEAWIDPSLVEQVENPLEKALLKEMKLCYQAGKGSRKLVPVLIPKDVIQPITKLVFEREQCGIHPDNQYLFPNTLNSLDHASGYHCLRAVVRLVPNLKSPHLLIADKFRHIVSTMFASLELPEEQRSIFVRHMGHSEAINRNVYQCPMAVREVTRVGQFLTTVDGGYSKTTSEQNVVDRENIVQPTLEDIVQPTLEVEIPLPITIKNGQQQAVTSSACKEKCRQRKYTKWTEKDSNLVREYFQKYITDISNRGQLPCKEDVLKFLEQHDILIGHVGKAALVRSKIFNEKKKFREGHFPKE